MVRWIKIPLLFLPLAVWLLLDHLLAGSGNYGMVVAYTMLPLFGLIGLFAPKSKKWTQMAALVLLAGLAVILILEIMMMPYQAYDIWFDLLARDSSRGRVSQLFIKLGSVLAALLSWHIIQKEKGSMMDLLYLPFFFFFMLYPTFYSAIACLLGLLIPMLIGRMSPYVLFILALSLLFGLSGTNMEPRGLRWVDRGTGRIYNAFIERFPQLPIYYQMPLYGHSLENSIDDGSSPTLTDMPLLEVRGIPGTWVYLRTRHYRGYNLNGKLAYHPGTMDRADLEPTDRTVRGEGIKVTLLTDFMNILPLTMDTRILETSQGRFLWNSPKQSLLWTEPPLLYEDSYRIYEENITEEEDEESLNLYGTAPPIASQQLVDLAEQLYAEDPLACATNIRLYLAQNYEYSLDTSPNENYTENFLFQEPVGYCLHFATAFVHLARLNGIPTRMVEGYVGYLPSPRDTQGTSEPGVTWLTGYSSHTWPEIYIEGEGWRIIEATPPFYHTEGAPPEDMSFLSQTPTVQVAPIGYNDFSIENEPFDLTLLWLLLIVPLSLMIYSYVKMRKPPLARSLKRLINLGTRQQWGNPHRIGWKQWNGNMEEKMGSGGYSKELLTIILRYRYGVEELSEDDKHKLTGYPAYLKGKLRKR